MQYMTHKPIYITDLSIGFGQKICFENFSATIYPGARIAIIGRNGTGKSSLIKALAGISQPSDGYIDLVDTNIGYVPQLIDADNLSGGERFNKKLSQVLAREPNFMLLDEPTNHLDLKNRQSLLGMLKRYQGTLILITHDLEVLELVDTLWHIDNKCITEFHGNYNDYIHQYQQKWMKLENTVNQLNKEKRKTHQQLMHEQTRAKNSKQMGEKHIKERKWPTITSNAKASRAETTSGKNRKQIEQSKQDVVSKLEKLYIPEIIIPRFNLNSQVISNKIVLNIVNGGCGYSSEPLVTSINITVSAMDKIVIQGDNGSGKSTILKALLDDSKVIKNGEWDFPKIDDLGYIDQHYSHLNPEKTPVEIIQEVNKSWVYTEIREHLNVFLLRKNEEVNVKSKLLSGGEKVRLSLALIAAKVPKLLLLDEITNNIDLETKEHLIQVLRDYPGAFILICHENKFVQQLNINKCYQIDQGKLREL